MKLSEYVKRGYHKDRDEHGRFISFEVKEVN